MCGLFCVLLLPFHRQLERSGDGVKRDEDTWNNCETKYAWLALGDLMEQTAYTSIDGMEEMWTNRVERGEKSGERYKFKEFTATKGEFMIQFKVWERRDRVECGVDVEIITIIEAHIALHCIREKESRAECSRI